MAMKSVNIDKVHEELIQKKGLNFSAFVKIHLGKLLRAHILQIYPECVICGEVSTQSISAFEDSEDSYYIDNMVGLCSSCHAIYKRNKASLQPKMQQACLQKQCDLVMQSNKEMAKFL